MWEIFRKKRNKKSLSLTYSKTYQIKISGIVQGVGFRPFIYRLAKKNNLKGEVTNTTEGVSIKINVENKVKLDKFLKEIQIFKPSPSHIEKIEIKCIPLEEFDDFTIAKSTKSREKFQLISPDLATCKNCLEDINNPEDKRRYCYPFTNCTNCGPRFTIIKKMPYDRPNTTMSVFKMCPECLEEYTNPLNRRFHAQPNACRICGPKLLLIDKNGEILESENPVAAGAQKIKEGFIVGIKSLGGFQIACDATSDKTVMTLRERKNRPFKPFAIMIKNIEKAEENFIISPEEKEILCSSKAPIVLLKKRRHGHFVSKHVSYYHKYEGVMLPYTPIHHLLFNHLDIPLIMTSGNISEEPIASENSEALVKLGSICDFFLIHNRDIYSKYDDSVIKIFRAKEMIIRRARGYAPYPVKLGIDIKNQTILSMGAQEKSTFCILKKNYAIVSQHLGDLDSLDSFFFYKTTLEVYKNLFNIEYFNAVAYDKHPEYSSTRLAQSLTDIPLKIEVQHHKAHVASVLAENKIQDRVIGIAWDGTGYGDDGKIWGSEIFIVDTNLNFTRIGHLKEKLIPGGETTIKKPYRMALTYLYYLWKAGEKNSSGKNKLRDNDFSNYIYTCFPFYKKVVSPVELDIIKNQVDTKFNSPLTTSMGRLFDAVSSILNLTHINSYEGEAATHLEMIACEDKSEDNKKSYPFKIEKIDEKYVIDDFYLVANIIKDVESKVPEDIISSKFHNTLAEILLEICKRLRERYSISIVTLSGGVFQNSLLLARCYDILQKNNFKVYSNFLVPVNDGGISLGQSFLAGYALLQKKGWRHLQFRDREKDES
ncbi:MAG: carbamoyltransferase HypF [Actinobacteria bacterium]|nr:carbamoyltransferase HypF [Actinomycetota bacterium]